MYTPSAFLSEYTEKQWQSEIEKAAAYLGYTHLYHTKDSRGSRPGFPDLFLLHPEAGRVVMFEVKTDKKSSLPTEDQVDWVRSLRKSGIHAWIVRPRDIDLVLDILAGKIAKPEVGTGNVPSGHGVGALLDNELKTSPRRPARSRSRYG